MSSGDSPVETVPSNEGEEVVTAAAAAEEKAATTTTKGKKGCCAKSKKFFLYDSGRKEIQAFYFNQVGRSVLFISFMFLSLGILQLAFQTAGCPQNENGSYENCGKKVYGMDPSSVLSVMALIGGLSTAVFMPYAGAVVDFSDHRLAFGRGCAILLVLTNFVQIFIFPSTWFAMVILQSVIAASTFMANSMVMWSYVNAPTDHILHGITSSGRLWETIAMLSFFIVVGIVQFTSGWDSVTVARFSQALASFVGGIGLFLAYKRYEPVKAVKTLENGKGLFVAGFVEIWSTASSLCKTEPSAFWFLIASMFNEAAISSFTNLAIIYLSEQLQMSSTDVVIFIMVNFVTNPIGVAVHRTLARKIGHKKNFLMCIAYTLVITIFLISFLYDPSHANLAYIFSVIYGIAYGWYYPSSNGYFVSLAPQEKVTELWGFNSFCSVSLSWAPPLIFTSLNESTGNLRLGLIGTVGFLFVGLCIALFIPEVSVVTDETTDEEAATMKKDNYQTDGTAVHARPTGSNRFKLPNFTKSVKDEICA